VPTSYNDSKLAYTVKGDVDYVYKICTKHTYVLSDWMKRLQRQSRKLFIVISHHYMLGDWLLETQVTNNWQRFTSLEVVDDASDAVESAECVDAWRADRTHTRRRRTLVHVCNVTTSAARLSEFATYKISDNTGKFLSNHNNLFWGPQCRITERAVQFDSGMCWWKQ